MQLRLIKLLFIGDNNFLCGNKKKYFYFSNKNLTRNLFLKHKKKNYDELKTTMNKELFSLKSQIFLNFIIKRLTDQSTNLIIKGIFAMISSHLIKYISNISQCY